MDRHVLNRFCEGTEFSKVRPLHEEEGEPYEELIMVAPRLPKGWWELARLTAQDRIEFVRSFWQSALPYIPHVDARIGRFFGTLDDIGIYLIQQSETDPLAPVMVLSEADDAGYFCGLPPAKPSQSAALQREFPDAALPADYVGFLGIHNGFYKAGDTGLLSTQKVSAACQEFWALFSERDPLSHRLNRNEPINPHTLIPFYQSFAMDSFQCFYRDWYPEQEMGNLYYSGIDHTLSDYTKIGRIEGALAFPTFLDWLVFYLELDAT